MGYKHEMIFSMTFVFAAKAYVKAIGVPVAFFASFYLIAFIVLLITWCR